MRRRGGENRIPEDKARGTEGNPWRDTEMNLNIMPRKVSQSKARCGMSALIWGSESRCFLETESGMVAVRGQGREEWGVSVCGQSSSLGRWNNSWDGWWSWLHNNVNILSHQTTHLKIIKMVNSVLCTSYHNMFFNWIFIITLFYLVLYVVLSMEPSALSY